MAKTAKTPKTASKTAETVTAAVVAVAGATHTGNASMERTVASIEKVRCGNLLMDAIARKVLIAIAEKTMKMEADGEGFTGDYNPAVQVTVGSITKGKSRRFIMQIAGVELSGQFAAKAFRLAQAQNRVTVRKTVEFDAEKVAQLAALLG
jgi:hypothetical protein